MIENIWRIILKYYDIYLKAFGVTILLAVATVVIGVILGSFFALMKLSKVKLFNIIATIYIEVLRGLPLLLQLWFLYIVGMQLGLNVIVSVIIALGLNSGAYVAEIIRAGIQAVDKGQTEAGISLGLSPRKVMFRIVLPQAIKNILPALGNEFVTVIKETSLAATFYVGDLMTIYKNISTITYLSIEPLIVVGVFYLLATFTLSKVIGLFEKRLKKSD